MHSGGSPAMRWGLSGAVALVVLEILINGPWLFGGKTLLLSSGDANSYAENAGVLALAGLISLCVIFGVGLLTARDGGTIGAGVFAAVLAVVICQGVSAAFAAVLAANANLSSLAPFGENDTSVRQTLIGLVLIVAGVQTLIGLALVAVVAALGAWIGRLVFGDPLPVYDASLDPDLQPGSGRYGGTVGWSPPPPGQNDGDM